MNAAVGEWRVAQLAMLIVATAGAWLAARALSPLQEAMRVSLSLSDNQVALLQGTALALPIVIAAIPLGYVVDRYSRVRLLFIFAGVAATGSLLTAFASGFAMIFAARCLAGLGMAASTIAVFSLVADLYPPDRRGRAKGLVVIGQFAGTSLAFAMGGWLLGALDSSESWRWAMLWLAAPTVLSGLLVKLTLREPPRVGVVVRHPSLREAGSELWAHRTMAMPLIAGIILAEIPMFGVVTWAAPMFSRTFALSSERIGSIMTIGMMLSGACGPILGGVLADHCHRLGGPSRTVAALSMMAVLGVPSGLFAVMPGVYPASILLVVCCLVSAATTAMAVTLFTIVIPNEVRGLCLAILSAVSALFSLAMAPLLISVVSEAMGGPAMIGKSLAVVCMSASALCAATFAMGRHFFHRVFTA